MNNIPELEIKGKEKPRFEFWIKPTKIKEWLQNFEFKFTIKWQYMKCKDCIKWITPHIHLNGTYGKCTKNKYWCNENYNCITKKEVKK